MEIKDITANTGKIDIVGTIVGKEEPRTFEKFGKEGRVCNATLKDNSGEVKLTLWNDDVDSCNVGDKVHIQNGWCSEYKGEKQLSTGKFGSLQVVEKGQEGVMTNDPNMLAQEQGMMPGPEVDAQEEDVQAFSQEEMIE